MKQEKEFLEVYDKYGAQIMRHISFRVSNEREAQDIFQETFLKTWKYIVKGQKIDNLRTFLYTVARNLIIDYYRQKDKNAISLDDLGVKEPFCNDLEEQTSNRLEMKKIKQAIMDLETDDEREVVYMRYVDDLSVKEIAELTQKTPNNIRVISYRGLKKLKEKLYV